MNIRTVWGVTQSVAATVATLVVSGGVLCWLDGGHWPDRILAGQIVFAGLLAGCVGFAELVSRYRDDPWQVFGAGPTRPYLNINILAGVAALALVRSFDVYDKDSYRVLKETLTAGLGAIAFFRSSLFTARVGGSDIAIGPSTMLKALLDSFDRQVSRTQAGSRADDIDLARAPGHAAGEIDFEKAKTALPMLCLTLVEMLPQEEQDELGKAIAALDTAGVPQGAKAPILLAKLMRLVGGPTVERAVTTLGPSIRS